MTLSLASGTTVTVGYADAGTGTAMSGTDYTALAAGTLTILAGETSGTIDVAVTGDALDEPNETVGRDPEQSGERDPGHGVGHGDDHGRRRPAGGVDHLAERGGRGQRLGDAALRGDPGRGERPGR